MLFRFSSEGRLVVRVRVGIGGLFCVRDCPCAAVDDSVAAFPGQVGDTDRFAAQQCSGPERARSADAAAKRSRALKGVVFPAEDDGKTTGQGLLRPLGSSFIGVWRP